ncbi:GNAT family N-acetyltransferase [Gallaecimonas kandeliae]|uniref:GNAT family N-acetyltransferase n=1 Tax=Gallaecimonas kandeliae TaxID=3029055 RepID=UPI002648FBCD|nr:GNAT family N-acetyltransferase [Gallaecimonas kandeliae]WKE64640.1 GNAT family N-acetyltransferase [Gallaecimonas kandeliae]
MRVLEVTAADFECHVAGLAELLHDCVAGGASVSFISPFSPAEAAAFWQKKVRARLGRPRFCQWLFLVDGEVAGTVLLDADLPPNQPHRGEVSKLLVSPRFRRRGIARQLMAALEQKARDWRLTLLTLDTATGSHAEPLYLSLGFEVAGVIPQFALAVDGSHYDATTVMYKRLSG